MMDAKLHTLPLKMVFLNSIEKTHNKISRIQSVQNVTAQSYLLKEKKYASGKKKEACLSLEPDDLFIFSSLHFLTYYYFK